MSIITRRSFGLGVATAALAACSSAPVPTDTYYRLMPVGSMPTRNALPIKGTVEVAPIRGEGVVNARALLFRGAAAQLQQYSYHLWADTPANMLQRGLVDTLRAAKIFETVAAPEMRLDRDYEIMGTLRKLEHDLAGSGRTVIEVELGERKVRGNKIELLKVYAADVAVAGGGMPAVVAGFSEGLGQVFSQFLADLDQMHG